MRTGNLEAVSPTMLEQFTGAHGRRFVAEALETQPVIATHPELATTLQDACSIEGWRPGAVIIQEGAPGNDICFILSGSVSILVNGREVAVRRMGQHVGEMALLSPGRPRSASVVAQEEVVIARTSSSEFSRLANAHPAIWRNLARVLADRLRQRSAFVKPTNAVPVLFIGCSSESLAIGTAIEGKLADVSPDIEVHLWSHGVFQPSTFVLESLERELSRADFAALIVAPDDVVTSRENTVAAPRDNVVFELGLFIGALGHARTFLIRPSDAEIKIPTDLSGFTPLAYKVGFGEEAREAVTPVCMALVEAIGAAGPR